MIKIALVDDHVLLRKSLGILIGMLQDFDIMLQAANGQDFINQLKTNPLPDIALLDITMPVMDGVETARWLKQNHPEVKVLALSMIKNDLIIIRMLKNGARGYILKDCEPSELKTALHQVYKKGYYYNELITPKMKAKDDPEEDITLNMLNEQLTHREEIELARLLGATDAFIRRPFFYLGALQGLAGGGVGLAILAGGLALLNRGVRALSETYGSSFELTFLAPGDALAVAGFAGLLGWSGAYLSVSIYLRGIQLR